MGKSIIQYSGAAIFIILGLVCLLYAFGKRKDQIKAYKDFINPPTKNYGSGFFILLGCVCLVVGILFLFLSRK